MTPLTVPHTAPGHSNVTDILSEIDRLADRGRLRLRDVIEAFGTASFVPLLIVPALLVVSPLSGIPLFSSVCGLSIALVAGQMLLGREHVWLPRVLMRQEIGEDRAHRAIARMRRLARWIDDTARDRFAALVAGPLAKLPQSLAVLAGLAMPFLELVPFSSSILGLAVLSFATGFLSRDGLFALFGMALMGIASLLPVLVYATAT